MMPEEKSAFIEFTAVPPGEWSKLSADWPVYPELTNSHTTKPGRIKSRWRYRMARALDAWDVLRGEKEAVDWDSREDLW